MCRNIQGVVLTRLDCIKIRIEVGVGMFMTTTYIVFQSRDIEIRLKLG
jgi:hypothetical protein